ncbi:MAG: outer membrane protein assembly factor BamE [Burkholderiales bacterium]
MPVQPSSPLRPAAALLRGCAGVLTALAAGCAYIDKVPIPPGIQPYRIDVQQGNVITPEMVMKLRPEMTRSQVRFVLGSPLLVDPFRTDRWDYVYVLEKAGKRAEKRQLTVYFENDVLLRLEGERDDLACADRKLLRGADSMTVPPVECAQYTAEAAAEKAAPRALPPAPPPEEKGFFGRMMEKIF